MLKRSLILIIASTMIFSLACSKKVVSSDEAKSENQSNKSLYQTTWVLLKVNAKQIKQAEGKKPVTLFIDQESKNVNGYAGCNRYFGKLEQKKDAISFSQMGATKMMCPPADMSIEDSYLQALNKVDNYVISDTELQLRKGETILLTFIAE
ncbi:MAG: META domain-containing protein [Bacteroidales bacterium]|jgi:heat shock protein HslJ|nr:META domain-containing protein [Bacteroidales bacterium]